MRRKAGAGRPPPEIGQITPARALRAAVAQAAQDVAGLVAVAGHVEEARTTLGPIVEALPEQPLIGLTEGPENRFGLVLLDNQTVAALIEMQTTGRVVPRPAEARPPTRTDAILCADFIDRVLELVEGQLAEAGLPEAEQFAGFRYAMALSEPRAITMTLDNVAYRKLTLGIDFGHGAKNGEATLLVPFDPPGRRGRDRAGSAGFTAALRDRVLAAEAHLAATLARREMTLAQVMRLTVGTVIALPRDVLAAIEIEDLRGRVVARGRLGQADGHRAVRILADSETAEMPPAGMAAQAAPLRLATAATPIAPDPLPALADSPGGGSFGSLGDAGFAPDDPGGDGSADLPDPATLAGLGALSGQG